VVNRTLEKQKPSCSEETVPWTQWWKTKKVHGGKDSWNRRILSWRWKSERITDVDVMNQRRKKMREAQEEVSQDIQTW